MSSEERILAMLEGLTDAVGKVSADVSELKGDMSGLKGDVAGLKTGMAELNVRVGALETNVTKIEAHLAEVDEKITDTRHRVILIEIDHAKQLGALFDGYDMLLDMVKAMRSNIEHLVAEYERLDLNVKVLASKVKVA